MNFLCKGWKEKWQMKKIFNHTFLILPSKKLSSIYIYKYMEVNKKIKSHWMKKVEKAK